MPVFHSYRKQPIDLPYKLTDWFLYEGNTGIQWVNGCGFGCRADIKQQILRTFCLSHNRAMRMIQKIFTNVYWKSVLQKKKIGIHKITGNIPDDIVPVSIPLPANFL